MQDGWIYKCYGFSICCEFCKFNGIAMRLQESADALLAKAQLEVAAEKGTLEGTVPATAAQLPATAQANPNDLVNRLNNL